MTKFAYILSLLSPQFYIFVNNNVTANLILRYQLEEKGNNKKYFSTKVVGKSE